MCFDDLFDFAKLDSETTNLDLLVVSTQELNVSIERVLRQIAGFVKLVADVVGKRIAITIINESFVGQILTIAITKRYTRSTDEDFALTADRYFVSVWTENVNLGVTDWLTDQDRSRRAGDLERR